MYRCLIPVVKISIAKREFYFLLLSRSMLMDLSEQTQQQTAAIILWETDISHLNLIIDFMYCGEVKVRRFVISYTNMYVLGFIYLPSWRNWRKTPTTVGE